MVKGAICQRFGCWVPPAETSPSLKVLYMLFLSRGKGDFRRQTHGHSGSSLYRVLWGHTVHQKSCSESNGSWVWSQSCGLPGATLSRNGCKASPRRPSNICSCPASQARSSLLVIRASCRGMTALTEQRAEVTVCAPSCNHLWPKQKRLDQTQGSHFRPVARGFNHVNPPPTCRMSTDHWCAGPLSRWR